MPSVVFPPGLFYFQPMKEYRAICMQGLVPLIFSSGLLFFGMFLARGIPLLFPFVILAAILGFKGLFIVGPNEARVLTFFGKYIGTVRESGFWFANPLAGKQTISLKVNNFQSPQLKVNDAQGNPIEIGAVIVWRVVDTAKALFEVQNYREFIHIQCETALRHLASHYPYEPHTPDEIALRSHQAEVATKLRTEVQERAALAGIEIIETQLSHLAYSPEIAQAMLRRQQAQAVIAARQMIVDGAVGMVEMALRKLEADGVVTFDNNSRAALVNNLMVTLVSEQHIQPVLSTAQVKG
jgi:regulator of protease activity HflC (stomatin/prohibitin superfamily)